MKISEIIITALLVIIAFFIGFVNNTNSSPKPAKSPTNSSLNINKSSTNEKQNLMMVKFDLEAEKSKDTLALDSISLDSLMIIKE